jgi:hypothetical protein
MYNHVTTRNPCKNAEHLQAGVLYRKLSDKNGISTARLFQTIAPLQAQSSRPENSETQYQRCAVVEQILAEVFFRSDPSTS